MSGPVAARLYDDHVDAIYGYVARRLGPELAVEVVAEVFEQALRTHERRSAKATDRGWLLALATALLRRHGATECRRLENWAAEHGTASSTPRDPLLPAGDAGDTEIAVAMRAAAELDPVDRDLLFLAAWEHCSTSEAAEATGLTPAAVRTRMNAIRKELKRLAVAGRHRDAGYDA